MRSTDVPMDGLGQAILDDWRTGYVSNVKQQFVTE